MILHIYPQSIQTEWRNHQRFLSCHSIIIFQLKRNMQIRHVTDFICANLKN